MTSSSSTSRALVVVGDSTRHIGLFRDLEGQPQIDLLVHPNNLSISQKVLSRAAPSFALHRSMRWQKVQAHYEQVVLLDSALSRLDKSGVKKLKALTSNLNLVLLNSLEASSVLMERVRDKLLWFSPAQISTFDPVDARTNGFHTLPPTYYSQQSTDLVSSPLIDCYFAGGIKGGRGSLIVRTYRHLAEHGATTRFDCNGIPAKAWNEHIRTGINWTSGWLPYSALLSRSASARCLIEVLQEGQHAQTIRYFEAITLNRLLLTNNPRVTELPYYDPAYVKVFKEPEDIDVSWVRKAPLPRYNYQGEFSPLNLPQLSGYTS